MRYVLILAVLAVAACTTDPTTGRRKIDVDKVKQAAITACAFVPTAQMVVDVYTDDPKIQTAEQIAAAICAVVRARAAKQAQDMKE